MAWVTFKCSGTNFEATLAQNAVDSGWTRCQDGYNWGDERIPSHW